MPGLLQSLNRCLLNELLKNTVHLLIFFSFLSDARKEDMQGEHGFLFCFAFWLCWVFITLWAFPSCGERGLLVVAMGGLLTAVTSLTADHGLEVSGFQ